MIEATETVELEIPALYKYLNVVTACVEAMLERVDLAGERDALTYNVTLAVHETCTNIIEHAYKGGAGRIRLQVAVAETPFRIVVDLLDRGDAFDWSRVEAPDLDTPHEGNYGLFLATSLMDDVVYRREGQTNHWHLVKQF